jgi:hypothetical protein
VVENQESEGARCHSRCRWNVLVVRYFKLFAKVRRRRTAIQPFSVIRVPPRSVFARNPRSHSRSTTREGGGSCGRRNYSKLVDHPCADPAPPKSAVMMAATNRPLGSAAPNKMQPVPTTGSRISYASIDCDIVDHGPLQRLRRPIISGLKCSEVRHDGRE